MKTVCNSLAQHVRVLAAVRPKRVDQTGSGFSVRRSVCAVSASMRACRTGFAVALALGLSGGVVSMALAKGEAPSSTTSTDALPAENVTLVEKGRYLAIAADCASCHTDPDGGKPFAGGHAVNSPLGVIYSSNITPSKITGIGNYTEQQFARAVRLGVRADGTHLYPAMPYTAYTLLADEDTRALYAYFMKGVTPVEHTPPLTELPFPFSIRALMAPWNLLFLDDKRFVPISGTSGQVNRGAYLVNALAHCGTCHTPRNFMMAERGDKFLAGAALESWYAPNITSDAVSGIGGWSEAQLQRYLTTGHIAISQAAGPMAEAVEGSFQHLRVDDVNAVVAYMETVPAIREVGQEQSRSAFGESGNLEPALRGTSPPNASAGLTSGAALYSGNCASCHQPNGQGSQGQFYPALYRNTATGAIDPSNLVSAILLGVDRTVDGHQVLMPRFDEQSVVNRLSDEQISAIANHVLVRYGNPSIKVRAADVAQARRGGTKAFLAITQPYIGPLLGLIALLLVALVVILVVRMRRKRVA